MTRKRTCSSRCHQAKGTRCRCWCRGFFHGKDGAGATIRADLKEGVRNIIYQPGFKQGETAYIEQKELPLEVASAK